MPMSDVHTEIAPIFVGIGGDSGSGKSTLTSAFYDLLGAERITTVASTTITPLIVASER